MPRYHRFCLPNRTEWGFGTGGKNTRDVVDAGHETGTRFTTELTRSAVTSSTSREKEWKTDNHG
jgi:hypothetical protein